MSFVPPSVIPDATVDQNSATANAKTVDEEDDVWRAGLTQNRNACCFILPVLNVLALMVNLCGPWPGSILEATTAHQTLLTPAPYTFLLVGVVFVGQAAFVGYQFSHRKRASALIQRAVFIWYFLSSTLFVIWQHCFVSELIAAGLFAICGSWLCCLCLFISVHSSIHFKPDEPPFGPLAGFGHKWLKLQGVWPNFDILDFWLVQMPFSITLGWLTYLVIAYSNIVVASFNPNNSTTCLVPLLLSLMMMSGQAATFAFLYNDPFTVSVTIWVASGISAAMRTTLPSRHAMDWAPEWLEQAVRASMFGLMMQTTFFLVMSIRGLMSNLQKIETLRLAAAGQASESSCCRDSVKRTSPQAMVVAGNSGTKDDTAIRWMIPARVATRISEFDLEAPPNP